MDFLAGFRRKMMFFRIRLSPVTISFQGDAGDLVARNCLPTRIVYPNILECL
jgi:hypothetical protein